LRCLLGLVEETLAKEPTFRISKFVQDISPDKWWMWDRFCTKAEEREPYDFDKAVAQACLSMLGQVKCQEKDENGKWIDLLGLGEPDPEVLPINLKGDKYKEINMDYSEIEQRLAASLVESAGDGKIELKDLHVEKASEMFGVPEEEVTDEQRKIAKEENFKEAYNGKPSKISGTKTGRCYAKKSKGDYGDKEQVNISNKKAWSGQEVFVNSMDRFPTIEELEIQLLRSKKQESNKINNRKRRI